MAISKIVMRKASMKVQPSLVAAFHDEAGRSEDDRTQEPEAEGRFPDRQEQRKHRQPHQPSAQAAHVRTSAMRCQMSLRSRPKASLPIMSMVRGRGSGTVIRSMMRPGRVPITNTVSAR